MYCLNAAVPLIAKRSVGSDPVDNQEIDNLLPHSKKRTCESREDTETKAKRICVSTLGQAEGSTGLPMNTPPSPPTGDYYDHISVLLKSMEKMYYKNIFPGCFNCGLMDHKYTTCSSPRRGIFCYRCGRPNVTIAICPVCRDGYFRQRGYVR